MSFRSLIASSSVHSRIGDRKMHRAQHITPALREQETACFVSGIHLPASATL